MRAGIDWPTDLKHHLLFFFNTSFPSSKIFLFIIIVVIICWSFPVVGGLPEKFGRFP
jgi:hypothetical protein